MVGDNECFSVLVMYFCLSRLLNILLLGCDFLWILVPYFAFRFFLRIFFFWFCEVLVGIFGVIQAIANVGQPRDEFEEESFFA